MNRAQMHVTIGSNRQGGTDGIITVRGHHQISLEWGLMNDELLVTMDLYSAKGGHIARLRRNQWTFNDHDRFDFTGDTSGFNLTDTKSTQVVLEARVVGRRSVVITQGAFFTSAGQAIEISTQGWNGATES